MLCAIHQSYGYPVIHYQGLCHFSAPLVCEATQCNIGYPFTSPNKDGSGWYVYYDASYQYFNNDNLPYAIMSITLFLVFGLCPLILLIAYPMSCFQKRCYGNSYTLRTFVDAFQGHYKDGTEP